MLIYELIGKGNLRYECAGVETNKLKFVVVQVGKRNRIQLI